MSPLRVSDVSFYLISRDPLVVAAPQEHPSCLVLQVRGLREKVFWRAWGVLEGPRCRARAYQPLPEQHILYWASWHQGFRRQEAPGATDLPCGFSQVIPHFWFKDRQNREIQEPGVSLASAHSGPREPCLGCAFL